MKEKGRMRCRKREIRGDGEDGRSRAATEKKINKDERGSGRKRRERK
jgi:hypothetical protein